jgi:leader peptidase (prepilin peptidase) / N-methyltransferase
METTSPAAVATLVLAAGLAAVAAIDLRTRRIPDWLNAALALAGLAATWALDFSIRGAALGMLAGYAALAGLAFAYRRLRGVDGIGLGDAKLLAAAGAWLGWRLLPYVVLIAAATGLAFVAVQRLRGRTLKAQDALAFGPFLALGVLIAWIVRIWAL